MIIIMIIRGLTKSVGTLLYLLVLYSIIYISIISSIIIYIYIYFNCLFIYFLCDFLAPKVGRLVELVKYGSNQKMGQNNTYVAL